MYLEEEDVFHYFGTSDLRSIDLNEFLISKGLKPAIIRGPALSSIAHNWLLPDSAVIMLFRPVEDILVSQQRVRWAMERPELSWYPEHYRQEGMHACEAKYRYWDEVQTDILGDRALELFYDTLQQHPLWVNKDDRGDFYSRQWQVGRPLGQRWMLTEEEYDDRYKPPGVVEAPASPRVRRARDAG